MKRLLPEDVVAGGVLGLMVVLVAIQVASRYVLHSSLSYTEEAVRYLFVWITFLGAASAIHHRGHLSVTAVPDRFGGRLRVFAGVAGFAGALAFMILLLIYGVRVVLLQMATKQTTAALGLPMWLIGLAVPAGAALCILRLVTGLAARGRDE